MIAGFQEVGYLLTKRVRICKLSSKITNASMNQLRLILFSLKNKSNRAALLSFSWSWLSFRRKLKPRKSRYKIYKQKLNTKQPTLIIFRSITLRTQLFPRKVTIQREMIKRFWRLIEIIQLFLFWKTPAGQTSMSKLQNLMKGSKVLMSLFKSTIGKRTNLS